MPTQVQPLATTNVQFSSFNSCCDISQISIIKHLEPTLTRNMFQMVEKKKDFFSWSYDLLETRAVRWTTSRCLFQQIFICWWSSIQQGRGRGTSRACRGLISALLSICSDIQPNTQSIVRCSFLSQETEKKKCSGRSKKKAAVSSSHKITD